MRAPPLWTALHPRARCFCAVCARSRPRSAVDRAPPAKIRSTPRCRETAILSTPPRRSLESFRTPTRMRKTDMLLPAEMLLPARPLPAVCARAAAPLCHRHTCDPPPAAVGPNRTPPPGARVPPRREDTCALRANLRSRLRTATPLRFPVRPPRSIESFYTTTHANSGRADEELRPPRPPAHRHQRTSPLAGVAPNRSASVA
ncbi:hypothetical protein DFH09DRAFT_1200448 [Mycena vulgaris]|nr:hypothetical protein DFH09DRAFT_1200448 [Mycena vulgaris]